jgi:hypothetical protein
MNLNTLNDFRHGVYGSFGKARDALFKPFGCPGKRSKRAQLS